MIIIRQQFIIKFLTYTSLVMPSVRGLVSNTAAILIAVLYSLAGQAHFTDRFTSDLAEQVDKMTPNAHAAFWFLGLEYTQV